MKRIISVLLIICMLAFTFVSCANDTSDYDDDGKNGSKDKNNGVIDPYDDNKDEPEDTTGTGEDTTSDPYTPVGPAIPEEAKYVNPLTGLPTTKELASQRPVAIMLNNIKVSTPQDGIGSADVIYECLAEGGITRLMMLTLDYSSLGVVGSVRSARDYFVELSQNHDALFVHAGGSPDAYSEILARELDYVDFVNGRNVDPYYYRDEWRMNNMGYVHSVVTTGQRLQKAISTLKNQITGKSFRTELKSGYESPLNFVEYGTEYIPTEGSANKISIPHSIVQTSSFVYDSERKVYDHYQFGNVLHIDRISGETVSTENVLILFMDQNPIPGDEAFRINVETVGKGDGFYLYGGKYISIKWSKADNTSPMKLMKADGSPLEINRGKTFISIVASATKSNVTAS